MALQTYPEFLQARTYSAAQMRQLLASLGLQEGVLAPGDLKVTQRGAGANMSVDVAAGVAFVQGDDVANQGLYRVMNDGVVNVTIGAAHASLPRLDQVVARVYDASVAGVSDVPTIEVVTGTAASGATLDNRTGAAALPNGAVRLADVLVAAADSSITNAEIRDRRPWARGAHAFSNQVAGADYSTSSASFVEMDAVNLSRRIECSGAPLVVEMNIGSATAGGRWHPRIDGVAPLGSESRNIVGGTTTRWRLSPTAGSHVISMYWRYNGAGTVTVDRGTDFEVQFEIAEDLRADGSNT